MSDAYYECEITGEIVPEKELVKIVVNDIGHGPSGVFSSEEDTKYIKMDEYPGDKDKIDTNEGHKPNYVKLYTLYGELVMIVYPNYPYEKNPENIPTVEREMWEDIAL